MDSPAITSAAQAVHQELVRKLAEQARVDRLRDQLRRARAGVTASSPARPRTVGRSLRETARRGAAGPHGTPLTPAVRAGPAAPTERAAAL